MREILFRGKDVVGNWWYGNLITKKAIRNENEIYAYAIQGISSDSYCSGILPETIGQFTGLCDKNGKNIFEGDILRSFDSQNTPICHIVVWDDAGFRLLHKDPNYGDAGRLKQCWIDEFGKEIVGNIFDNSNIITT